MAYETESPLSSGVPNNTTGTANLLYSGVRMTGALDSAADLDYFAITTDRASLISLDISSMLLSATNHWQVRLLDGNGDYLRTLATSVAGSPLVNGGTQTGSTLVVDGLASLPANGSRFTLATTGADTTIYTITSATALSSGASTFTLDKTLGTAPADNTALAFDPAQILVSQSASLVAQVSSAGTYYVEVLQADGQNAAWDASDYQLTATVLPTVETDAGDSASSTFAEGKQDAVIANNRLLAGVAMTGNLSSGTDADYWVFSTAAASDFTVAFAAASGIDLTPQWKIDVSDWSGQVVRTVTSNSAGSLSAGTSAFVDVDDALYPSATTFVVKVSATSSSVYNTGSYTLKVSGTGLDLNDAPALTVGTVTSSKPWLVVPSGKINSLSVGDGTGAHPDGTGVKLTDLFSVSDPDSGQSISSYWVRLQEVVSGSTDAYIRVDATDYGFGAGDSASSSVTLTAAQMATATFYAGQAAGDLTLDIQAFDSTNAADDSGASAVLGQTLHLVSGAIGVAASTPNVTALTEHLASPNGVPHAATFTLVLNDAPTQDVKVYLTDANDQLDAFKVGGVDSSVATFTSLNWDAPQTVTVTAAADGRTEGANQTAGVSFQVISADANYDGYAIAPLAFTIADNAAPALATPTTVVYTDTSASDSFAATTSGSASGTLSGSDADGDSLNYGISGGTDGGSTVSLAGSYGTLTVTKASGAYAFAPNASAINALAGNATDAFTLTATDGIVVTPAFATFTVNLVGANDAPALTASLTSTTYVDTSGDDTPANVTGTLSTVDPDLGGETASYSITGQSSGSYVVGLNSYDKAVAGSYGTLYLKSSTGAYEFVANDAAIEGRLSNASEDYTLAVTDKGGLTDSKTFTVNITAANDPPALTASVSGASYADTSGDDTFANVTGTLSTVDRDTQSETATYSIANQVAGSQTVNAHNYNQHTVGSYGTLYLDSGTGAYEFVANDTAIEGRLSSATEDYTFTVTDKGGLTHSQTFTVDITGTNDLPALATPVSASYTNTAADDVFANATGTLVFSDRDIGQTPAFGITGGTLSDDGLTVSKVGSYGTLTVNALSGAYTFAPNDAAIEGVNSGATSETFTVTAGDGAASTPASAAFTVNLIDAHAGQTVSVLAYSWKTHTLLDGVNVGFSGATAHDTAGGGAASFTGVSASSLDLTATLAADSNTGGAVNLQDAIAILKMIVGLNVNSGGNALSPYQAIAADYDANGSVNLTDAIGVLKHVVGLTAPDPAWVFLNEADGSVPGMATGLSGKTPPALSANVATDNSVGLVGVLRGDVDGSWAAPAQSQDLDTTQASYFTDLVGSLNANAADPNAFSLTQWGIYPAV